MPNSVQAKSGTKIVTSNPSSQTTSFTSLCFKFHYIPRGEWVKRKYSKLSPAGDGTWQSLAMKGDFIDRFLLPSPVQFLQIFDTTFKKLAVPDYVHDMYFQNSW